MKNQKRKVPYFAKHEDGLIGGFFGEFSFLSNFYILENGVCFEETYYPTVEHAYQAAKYPIDKREQFIGISPAGAKKLGQLAPITKRQWDKKKYLIMQECVRQKFVNNYKLKEMLLMTDGCTLEERNNWGDQWWGVTEDGVGENNLGKILMQLRDYLKKEEKEKKKLKI